MCGQQIVQRHLCLTSTSTSRIRPVMDALCRKDTKVYAYSMYESVYASLKHSVCQFPRNSSCCVQVRLLWTDDELIGKSYVNPSCRPLLFVLSDFSSVFKVHSQYRDVSK